MKHIKSITVAAGLACATLSSRADIELLFNTDPNVSHIDYSGGSFQLLGSPTTTILINAAFGSSATGDAILDEGGFAANSSFNIASISGTGTQGTLSGSSSFTIRDNLLNTFTTTVSWSTISLVGNQATVTGILNLSPNDYTGSQADLQTVANGKSGMITLYFSPPQDTTLAQIETSGMPGTWYAGQIFASTSVLPEPTTVIAGALLLLPFGLGGLRIIRKHLGAVRA
jgi:hypothetical protein